MKSATGTLLTANLKVKGGFSELYFMDKNHRQRFFIDSSEKNDYIDLLAKELGFLLKIEIQPYSPKK